LAEENMDATKTICNKTAFFVLTALLLAASGRAQTLSANPGSVSLSGTAQSVQVSITSLTGTDLSFTATRGANDTFYTVNGFASAQATTPATLFVSASSVGSCNPSCSGSITVHPSSGTDLIIPVSFTAGSGGGGTGNLIVINPTAVTLSVSSPGQYQSGTVNLSTSNGSTVSCTANSNQNWLTFANGGTSTSAFNISGAATSLGFTANSSILGANTTNSATVTISCPSVSQSNTFGVTFTVGTGGTTTGSLFVNPSSLVFNYPSGSTSGTFAVSSSTTTSFHVLPSTNSGGNWLLANSTSLDSGPWGVPNTIPVSVDPNVVANLGLSGSATYTGQLLVYNSANTNDFSTVSVTLNVYGGSTGTGAYTLSPTSALMGYPNVASATYCSSATASSSCTVTVTSNISGVASYFAFINTINGGNWLLLNGQTGTVAGTTGLTLSLNPNGLSSLVTGNNYNAQVYVCNPNNCSGNYSILNVTLQVGTGGGGTISSLAAPTALSFSYQTGTGKPLPSYQTALVNNNGQQYTETPSVTTTQQWLKVYSISTPQTLNTPYLQVSVDPTGLSAGSYQGTINVALVSGAASQNITVNLLVTASPVVQASPGSVYFFGNSSQSSNLSISASDGSSVPVSLSSSQSWITLSSTSLTTSGSLLVTVNPANLCNGLNSGTINMTSTGTANPTDTIPVVILVSGSTNTNCSTTSGYLTFSPSTPLTFTVPNNISLPTAQTLTVTSATQTQGTVATVTSNGGNWLLINGNSYPNAAYVNFPVSLTISANPAGLITGTYTGQIQFVAGGITQSVNVTLNVGTGGSGNITASPTSVTVTAPVGTTPAGQTITVNAASGTTGVQFTVNVSTTSGGSWLSASAGGTTLANGSTLNTPATITLNFNPAGLNPGTQYSGSVVLTPNGGTTITIPVSFTVQPQTVVSAAPTTLTFRYTLGDAAPAAQAISVSGSGSTPLPFSATAQTQSGGNWLTVTPTSGNTPATVNSGLNTGAITAPGTFTGTIVVAGTGTASGSTTINVTLIATAPLPTINQVGNAASYIGGAISPGEIITLFGTGLGPTPAAGSPTVDSTGKVTTTLGGVQVLINGFACPMIYASNTQVSAVVPYEVARFLSATILVQYLGQSSNGISAAVAPTAPGIFTANASGTGPGAILNANLSQNSPGNPANKGDVVAIYMTGEGQTAPAGVTGKVTTVSSTSPLTPQPLLPIGVTIDGQPATVTFYGEAPGLVSGVLQVNVTIPAGARSGNLPLLVNIGAGTSQSGVTVSVR
jgi:uncharacterized protein (TIGR03437 family)